MDRARAERPDAARPLDRELEVPVRTVDDLIAQHGLPAFVKIDVEGFEANVLAGLSRPVARSPSSTSALHST